jgi:hypothetical protein
MTRRRVLLFGSVAVAVALAVAVWLVWPAATAITADNATRIKEGMTHSEVEAILGGPARDDTAGPVERMEPPEFAPPDARGISWRITIADLRAGIQRRESDHARVWVHFDENGLVTDCQVFLLRRTKEGALAYFAAGSACSVVRIPHRRPPNSPTPMLTVAHVLTCAGVCRANVQLTE